VSKRTVESWEQGRSFMRLTTWTFAQYLLHGNTDNVTVHLNGMYTDHEQTRIVDMSPIRSCVY
jgi:hypothetical protein